MISYFKSLYKRYLYGSVLSEEFLEMRHGINNASESELESLLKEEWDTNNQLYEMHSEDKERIQSRLNLYISFEKKKSKRSYMMKIAAVLLAVFTVGTLFFSIFLPSESVKDFIVEVKPGNKAQITLPDNSIVWLNSNSRLVYSKDDLHERNIQMSGEAFFKVSKDATRPFNVKINDLTIQVLGTSFNINANDINKSIETTLVEGSVKISAPELITDYYLKPNEKAIYNCNDKSINIAKIENLNDILWKDNIIYFESEEMQDVVKRLENWYGKKIVLDNQMIGEERISGSFKNQNLEIVLKVFQIQFGLKYKISNDTVYIY